jgi:hypothetical protein
MFETWASHRLQAQHEVLGALRVALVGRDQHEDLRRAAPVPAPPTATALAAGD